MDLNYIVYPTTLVSGAVAGAFFKSFFEATMPSILKFVGRKPGQRDNLVGVWDSYYGPSKDEIKTVHERLEIIFQKGNLVKGSVRDSSAPGDAGKIWEIQGLFVDKHHLQLMYFISDKSENPRVSDFGCYLFIRQIDGRYQGMAIGEETNENGVNKIVVDHRYMKLR